MTASNVGTPALPAYTHITQTGASSPNDFVFGRYDPATERFGNVSGVFSLGVGSHWSMLGNDTASGSARYLLAGWVDAGYGAKHGPATPSCLTATVIRAVRHSAVRGDERLVAEPVAELEQLHQHPPLLQVGQPGPVDSQNYSLARGGGASIEMVIILFYYFIVIEGLAEPAATDPEATVTVTLATPVSDAVTISFAVRNGKGSMAVIPTPGRPLASVPVPWSVLHFQSTPFVLQAVYSLRLFYPI